MHAEVNMNKMRENIHPLMILPKPGMRETRSAPIKAFPISKNRKEQIL